MTRKARSFCQGELWAYRTRPGEEASTVLINRIDADATLGQIFHISLTAVKIKNARASGGTTSTVAHLPVSQETLDKSLTKRIGTAPINADYLDGYGQWRRAFDQGEAGIFSIDVAEIVSFLEAAFIGTSDANTDS